MQKNEDVDHQYVNMYCNTNQFPKLTFCGPHNKPPGIHILIKHYLMRFDQKLGHGTYAICCTTCVFI